MRPFPDPRLPRRWGRLASWRYGFGLPARAARLILRRPPLLALSLVPIALSLALSFFVLARLQSAARDALTAYLTARWGLGADSGWALLAVGLARVALFVFGALSFSIVASVVASPFNDALAGRAERYVQPVLSPPPRLPRGLSLAAFRTRLRWVAIDFAKSCATLLGSLLALAASWVPGLNAAALALSCLLLTFQYIGYAQTRRGQGVGAGLRFLWRHSYACLGLGSALFLLFAIPLLSIFALPLAVVGGTLLIARAPGGEDLPGLR